MCTLTKTKIFRAPYGQLRKKQYRSLLSLNYKIVFWDVISYDYEKISKEDCYKNVYKHIKNGSIVLFHDNIKAEQNVKYALSETLKDFSEKGYSFKAIT
jgi:peptidoglycan/xylan/chitin deacetylase (PgdA/CDA1 family)